VHARGGICVGLKGDVGAPGARLGGSCVGLKGDVGAPGARLGGVLCGVKRCCGVKGSVRANTSVHSCWG